MEAHRCPVAPNTQVEKTEGGAHGCPFVLLSKPESGQFIPAQLWRPGGATPRPCSFGIWRFQLSAFLDDRAGDTVSSPERHRHIAQNLFCQGPNVTTRSSTHTLSPLTLSHGVHSKHGSSICGAIRCLCGRGFSHSYGHMYTHTHTRVHTGAHTCTQEWGEHLQDTQESQTNSE